MALTLADAITRTGVDVLDYLDRDAALPVAAPGAPCIQGDVSILPVAGAARTPMSRSVPVVRGEVGGNTHSLHADGPCFWDPARDRDGLRLGTLTVPEGSSAVMLHPEHGGIEFAPGTYDIGRQREYAGEWRQVAD